VTLVYISHDEQHNNAVAPNDYVLAKMRTPSALPDEVEAHRVRASRSRGTLRRPDASDDVR